LTFLLASGKAVLIRFDTLLSHFMRERFFSPFSDGFLYTLAGLDPFLFETRPGLYFVFCLLNQAFLRPLFASASRHIFLVFAIFPPLCGRMSFLGRSQPGWGVGFLFRTDGYAPSLRLFLPNPQITRSLLGQGGMPSPPPPVFVTLGTGRFFFAAKI